MTVGASLLCVAFLTAISGPSQAGSPVPAPTPTIPNLIGDPSPQPEPSHAPHDPEESGPEHGSSRPPSKHAMSSPRAKSHGRKTGPHDRARRSRKLHRSRTPRWVELYRTQGFFTTTKLDGLAARLRRASPHRVFDVYKGLPVGGPSTWTNSWGAPRREFGNHYRHHEGQDLFCQRGAPLLAVEDGTVEFDKGGLGGKIVRLHFADGSYWYYAHLSRWNPALQSGDRVGRGEVVGFCGTTGNAAGTPPHLHFGWYVYGVALDPIDRLEQWLESAERAAQHALKEGIRQSHRPAARPLLEGFTDRLYLVRLNKPRQDTALALFVKLLGLDLNFF